MGGVEDKTYSMVGHIESVQRDTFFPSFWDFNARERLLEARS
jgi:hypothetical protein